MGSDGDGSLLLVTGPPGAGKSTVASLVAREAALSVLVEGDEFFAFLTSGAIEPWLPGSHDQNVTVTRAAGSATGTFTRDGYMTVFDGVVGPWLLPTFAAATELDHLDYAILHPPVDTCIHRVATRKGHGFSDEAATRKMHAQFSDATGDIDPRHVLTDLPDDEAEVARLIRSLQATGQLRYSCT